MKIRIQVVIEDDDHVGQPEMKQIACLERDTEHMNIETLGLSLGEAKEILATVQTTLITHQAAQFMKRQCCCSHCGAAHYKNGTHHLTIRTLFGTVKLASQRFSACACQRKTTRRSFCPLSQHLPERTTPEFRYLQAKWSSLMSYGVTSSLLEEVLPLSKRVSTSTLSRCVQRVAQRADSELGEEQFAFIEGCPSQWEQLPLPSAPLIVGIDGGYVHAREATNRKAGSFEVIVGKSMTSQGASKRFGFVYDYDTKPKRRVYDLLIAQGMQMNQQVIFLSDGGDTVRDLQLYLNPQAEHLLDWFHITMRLTVLGQLTKGITVQTEQKGKGCRKQEKEEDEAVPPTADEVEKQLERVKWYLWHGNAFNALQVVTDLEEDLEVLEAKSLPIQKLLAAVHDFNSYITANQNYIVNYGDRYRNGETISTAFVESTVNEVISKRFVKKQQMRWTKEGAHHLLQVRVQVLNDELRQTFRHWYPGMGETLLATDTHQAA